jgi:DNA-binding transcriptional LysR family regulator
MAAPDFVAALIGGRLVRALAQAAPNAGFAIETHDPDAALEAVRRGQIDLAVGGFPRMQQGLQSEELFQDDYCVIARRGHPRIQGVVSGADFLREKVIFASAESEVGEDLVIEELSSIRIQATAPGWLNVLLMVAASDALGALPRRLAQSQAEILNLQVMEPPMGQRRISVMAVRRGSRADPGLDWFVEQLRLAAA